MQCVTLNNIIITTKNIRDRNAVYRVAAEQSRAEAKWLSQTSDKASTMPHKITMPDHLKKY